MLLNEKRRLVCEVAKEAHESGLCLHGAGNFSEIDRETGLIAITPSGVDRKSMTPEQIIIINLDGDVVESMENLHPSTEWQMHLNAYESRQDITSVVHTHSHYATAFAIAERPIDSVVFEALGYGGKTALAKFAMAGSIELAESIVEPLKEADVALMCNHGVLIVGECDVKGTLMKALYLEDVARLNHHALALNPNLYVIPQSEFSRWEEEVGSTIK